MTYTLEKKFFAAATAESLLVVFVERLEKFVEYFGLYESFCTSEEGKTN